MISFNEFVKKLKDGGSDLSARMNTNLLNGVKDMPVTHQTGFGNAWRKGIHPNNVNVDEMNSETHGRMLLAGIGIVGCTKLIKEDSGFAQVLGIISGSIGAYQLIELYQDWVAGFEAAKHIGPWYAERMNPKRRLLVDLGKTTSSRAYFLTK